MIFPRYLSVAAMSAILVTGAFADDEKNEGNNNTPPTVTRDFTFPPVTLGSTETARITVVNTAPPATGSNPAPSCTGTFSFIASGATPPTVTPAKFTVGAGQFAFLDLPYGKSGISTSPGEVVGMVSLNVTPGSKVPCSLQMSEITYDTTTGAGHVALGNAAAQLGVSSASR